MSHYPVIILSIVGEALSNLHREVLPEILTKPLSLHTQKVTWLAFMYTPGSWPY
jgi:hypothetical protein